MLATMGGDGTLGAFTVRRGSPRLESAPRRSDWLRPGVVGALVGAAAALGCAVVLVVALPGGTSLAQRQLTTVC